jgi:pilus assembly protein Flp/PilA
MERIKKFFNDESGASAVEYCFLLALIALAIVSVVGTLGGNIKSIFLTASKYCRAR